ncbi:hypothetical protein BDB00DRAFT_818554 [Zychaea mexicana]|uniref:uncharacterized protein n=1 Tax=Zychaea mexicana TaxID=64656 RepID=UPI0022FECA98|nr:uncharacterized protein BDB00DRAFT_818554 [Zychaea mexicana]KAI9494561.1 hypothetical protein BDB00DRAFT_818554 [Zychaea mexicana]
MAATKGGRVGDEPRKEQEAPLCNIADSMMMTIIMARKLGLSKKDSITKSAEKKESERTPIHKR